MDVRFSQGARDLGLRVERIGTGPGFQVKHIFTTRNGSWEPSKQKYSIEQWARNLYLKPWGHPHYFDDAGGDHHLFAALCNERGEFLYDAHPIIYNTRDGRNRHMAPTKHHSGWGNNPITGSFSPEVGEEGYWLWYPQSAVEMVIGGGLPNNHHVSSFAVWQWVDADTEPEPEPPVDPPDPTEAMQAILRHASGARTALIAVDAELRRIEDIARGK